MSSPRIEPRFAILPLSGLSYRTVRDKLLQVLRKPQERYLFRRPPRKEKGCFHSITPDLSGSVCGAAFTQFDRNTSSGFGGSSFLDLLHGVRRAAWRGGICVQ